MSEHHPDPSDHLDESILNELEALLEDDFVDLIETFLTDAQVRVEELSQAVESTVADDIRRAAHSFKGSSLNVGAAQLSAWCKEMEDLAREGRTVYSKDILDKIEQELAVVDRLFRNRYL